MCDGSGVYSPVVPSPWSPLPFALVQVGGGEAWGRTTGAKALFCLTADTMFAGEKEKMPEELLQLEGRLVDEAMVGLEGTTEKCEAAAKEQGGKETERKGKNRWLGKWLSTTTYKIYTKGQREWWLVRLQCQNITL